MPVSTSGRRSAADPAGLHAGRRAPGRGRGAARGALLGLVRRRVRDDAAEAAASLRTAADDGRQVAILLADDAAELLEDGRTVFRLAAELFPDVRRGLLVEWGAWGDRTPPDQI